MYLNSSLLGYHTCPGALYVKSVFTTSSDASVHVQAFSKMCLFTSSRTIVHGIAKCHPLPKSHYLVHKSTFPLITWLTEAPQMMASTSCLPTYFPALHCPHHPAIHCTMHGSHLQGGTGKFGLTPPFNQRCLQ